MLKKLKKLKKSLDKYWYKFWKPNPAKEKIPECFENGHPEAEKQIPWGICQNGKRNELYKEHLRKYDKVHYKFKNKFLIPCLAFGKISEALLGDAIVKDVRAEKEGEPQNRFLEMFEDAYDETIRDWNLLFRQYRTEENKDKGQGFWEKQAQNLGDSVLHMFKKLVLTVCMWDTAYREVLNIFVLNLGKNFMNKYKDCEKIHHLFYGSGNPFSIQYYHGYNQLRNEDGNQFLSFQLKPVFKSEEDARDYKQRLKEVQEANREDKA